MSGHHSGPEFFDLSDPNDPFYADPFEPDSSDVIVDAGFVTALDRAVVDALEESDRAVPLTFERSKCPAKGLSRRRRSAMAVKCAKRIGTHVVLPPPVVK